MTSGRARIRAWSSWRAEKGLGKNAVGGASESPAEAGEVAPLMLTGVVKLAPALPLDGYWPFIHLDRKFMHLGFHIYDVGFQSPNVDAARPMVFVTTMLLLLIVVLLNLFAIATRNRLRRKYATSAV